MNSQQPYQLVFLTIIIIALNLAGCASHRDVNLKFTDTSISNKNIPIRVKLDMSEKYKNTQWKKGQWVILLGTNLTKHAEALVSRIFKKANHNDYDAILVPEIISVNHQISMWAGQESTISVTNKWTLLDKSGRTIWVKSIIGVGVMEGGTAFTLKTRGEERALLAVDDLFVQTISEMTSSVEIEAYAKSL